MHYEIACGTREQKMIQKLAPIQKLADSETIVPYPPLTSVLFLDRGSSIGSWQVTNLLTDPISVMSIGTCVSATQTLTLRKTKRCFLGTWSDPLVLDDDDDLAMCMT